ncbi:hypothetical protein HDU82_004557 [Entophlyctis luteolus]|nr:hypothetical protein HDU82_004557 [Entophlyctis luteolus]
MACRINSVQSGSSGPNKGFKVLYYNTHGGCNENMKAVMTYLNLPLDTFNPMQVSNYGMTRRKAEYLINTGHVEMICAAYDVQRQQHGGRRRSCARTKVVVEITNRFDWGVRDVAAYHALLRALAGATPTRLRARLFWVANNNFDKAYAQWRLQTPMPFMRVLRPLGAAAAASPAYPWDLPAQSPRTIAAQLHHSAVLAGVQTNYSLDLVVFPLGHKYGGPKNLLKFKAWLEFPYQFSTMKFYENIAHGVPQLFPSPRLLDELYSTGVHVLLNTSMLKEMSTEDTSAFPTINGFPSWSGAMDHFAPEFSDYVYYFDSLEELKQLSSLSEERLDSKNVRTRGPKFYEEYRREILIGWEALFNEMI